MSANKILYGVIFVCSTINLLVFAETPDDGCGHSVLGPNSGFLSSKNYPGLYPNNSWCEWKIRVSGALRIVLTFEDLSIEGEDCTTDYLKVLKESKHVFWQYCEGMQPPPRLYPLYTDESKLTVSFRASRHTSGRGFRLSYSTVDHGDVLTCSNKSIHFSLSQYRKYCPAGCGAEAASEVSGDISHGYRHTSVLCKAAVHAGVILDRFGGQITVEQHPGLRSYEPVQANGIQSKSGSLSETLFTFVTSDCTRQAVLQPVSVSSSWLGDGSVGPQADWSPNITLPDSTTDIWTSSRQWQELDLGEKKRITGILTSGLTSSNHFVKSYKILYKEKSRWRTYTQYNSSEDMIFEGNMDSLYQARNAFHPAITARYVRVVPLQWHQGLDLNTELLGCALVRNSPSEQMNVSSLVPPATRPKPVPDEADLTKPVPSQPDLVNMVGIGTPVLVLVVLLLTGICLWLHKKKNKENTYDSTDKPQTGCWKPVKHPSARNQSTEFTFSYSSEKDLPKMDLVTSTMADYQQPLMLGAGTVSRKGSTFRPMDTEAKGEANEAASHYDYLHTANQYALPLTNQEPEYATPIIERHAFRKDGFLPDPSYSVPGVVLGKSPSFKSRDGTNYRKEAEGLSGGYQTPQVKSDRAKRPEGVYDSPKVVGNSNCSPYQKPQAKVQASGSYLRPRDCAWPELPVPGRPDPEGSSQDGT